MTRALLRPSLFAVLLFGCSPAKVEPAATTAKPEHPAAEHEAQQSNDGSGTAAGLHYAESMRGGARPGDTVPMVVFVHGLGDKARPELFEDFDHPARFIMPQAPRPHGPGFSWFRYRIGDNEPEQLADDIGAAAEQLARAIGELAERRPTQGKPIIAGFSQGGMLSYAVAIHHPERVALSVPLAGTLPRPLWPTSGPEGNNPPIAAAHGDADTVVPIEPTRKLAGRLHELGFAIELKEFAGLGHSVSPEVTSFFYAQLRSHLSN